MLELAAVSSKFLRKNMCSQDIYFDDNEAIKDAKLIISIINSLDISRVKEFYKNVRAFHFPNY